MELVVNQIDVSWDLYKSWISRININCAANQIIPQQLYEEFLLSDEILKIVFIEESELVGLIIASEDKEIMQFYNPDNFYSEFLIDTFFVPRGGIAFANIAFDVSVMQSEIKRNFEGRSWLLDIPNCEELSKMFPQAIVLDEMVGYLWEKNNCNCNIGSHQENAEIADLMIDDCDESIFVQTWNMFKEGFDNLHDSICPTIFDEGFYREIFFIKGTKRIFLKKEEQYIGGLIAVPAESLEFANMEYLRKFVLHGNCYFVFDMAIIKKHRSIINFRKIARYFASTLEDGSYICMDHSVRANPHFRNALIRCYGLSDDQLLFLGKQQYKLLKS